MENNGYDIYFSPYFGHENNYIYHNNFMGTQVFDPHTNYWDNGYSSGGNYWSDYAGVDENRGENQNIPGSDGIGDTPYIIPGDNNRDRYPLMDPWPVAHLGLATFELENLYKVSLEKDLQLYQGSKLVVKFYKYNLTLQDNSVIDEFAPPENIKENEDVPHPRGAEGWSWGTVQIAKLVLTGENTENEISTIASFTVHQSHLRTRDIQILILWGGNPGLHDAFRAEDFLILLQWASAPP